MRLRTTVTMDFLKSAVASAIAKSSSLPFILEGQVDVEDSLWTLNNATRKVVLPALDTAPYS